MLAVDPAVLYKFGPETGSDCVLDDTTHFTGFSYPIQYSHGNPFRHEDHGPCNRHHTLHFCSSFVVVILTSSDAACYEADDIDEEGQR